VTSVTVGAWFLAHVATINNGSTQLGQQEPKMTATFFTAVRKVSLVLAFTTSFAAVSSTASFAFSSEAQQQCTGDAFRLCSSEIPNIPKITACMMKHRADLSVGCRGVMDRELASQKSGKLAAQ
jgi:hypothetical protein